MPRLATSETPTIVNFWFPYFTEAGASSSSSSTGGATSSFKSCATEGAGYNVFISVGINLSFKFVICMGLEYED